MDVEVKCAGGTDFRPSVCRGVPCSTQRLNVLGKWPTCRANLNQAGCRHPCICNHDPEVELAPWLHRMAGQGWSLVGLEQTPTSISSKASVHAAPVVPVPA